MKKRKKSIAVITYKAQKRLCKCLKLPQFFSDILN